MKLRAFYQTFQNAFSKLSLNPFQTFEVLSKHWEPRPQLFKNIYHRTEQWYSSDNEQNFKKRSNKQQYTEHCITYDLDKQGFRIKKEEHALTNKPIIACFGCSNTFGVGLKYEDTWPVRLSSLTDYKYTTFNYGVPGGSFDHISRLIYNYLLLKTPKIICCLLPDIFRREMFDSTTTTNPRHICNFRMPSDDLKDFHVEECCRWFNFNVDDWKAYRRVSGEDNSIFNFYKNLKFVEALCETKRVPIIFMTWDHYLLSCLNCSPSMLAFRNFVVPSQETFDYLMNQPQKEKARDGGHLGKKAATLIAEMYYNKIINSL